jgi:hypothetical protein
MESPEKVAPNTFQRAIGEALEITIKSLENVLLLRVLSRKGT